MHQYRKDSQMKNLIFIVLGLIIFGWAIAYASLHANDIGFLDNVVSSLLSTMLALIFGIPTALFISTREQQSQERQRERLEAKRESEQKEKILSLIKKELETNLNSLKELRTLDKYNHEGWRKLRLRDEFWKAFSDGGELHWIRDIELLSIIAGAYYHIKPLIILQDSLTRSNAEGVGGEPFRYMNFITSASYDAEPGIESALKRISEGLKK